LCSCRCFPLQRWRRRLNTGHDLAPGGRPTRWDYAFVDQREHRLYVAHGTQTDIIDTAQDTLIGQLADTRGVHGIATADELGVVFTSNGADDEIGVYDLATQKRLRSIKAGGNRMRSSTNPCRGA